MSGVLRGVEMKDEPQQTGVNEEGDANKSSTAVHSGHADFAMRGTLPMTTLHGKPNHPVRGSGTCP